jgi:Tfp pilus assembly PilM family ATPase
VAVAQSAPPPELPDVDLDAPAPAAADAPAGAAADAPAARLAESPLLPNAKAVLAALTEALRLAGPPPDVTVLALPAELVGLRTLEFPFSDPRKIVSVLAYELEGQIPFDLGDLVHDHLLVPSGKGGALAQVAYTETERARRFLELVSGAGLDPTILTVAPFCYGYLNTAGDAPDSPPLAVLDVGHRTTHLAVLLGSQTIFARSISRGGEAITRGLAARYQVPPERAAEIKHGYAFVPGPSMPPVSPDLAVITEAVQTELRPLLTGVKQAMQHLRSRPELLPQRLLLCGGGASLPGLAQHLESELEVPVTTELPRGTPTGGGARGKVLAGGLVRAGLDRQRIFDFRQGPLAAEEKRSILIKRGLYFGWAAVLLIGLIVANGFISLSRLRKEDAALRRQLSHLSTEVWGQGITDPAQVDKKLGAALKRKKATSLPLPNASAYAILSEISRRLPAKDKVTLDITRITIKDGKVDLEATTASPTEAENVVAALKEIPCFKKVTQGQVTEVSVREVVEGEVKQDKRRRFTVDIAHECM